MNWTPAQNLLEYPLNSPHQWRRQQAPHCRIGQTNSPYRQPGGNAH